LPAPRLLLKGRMDTEVWRWAALDVGGTVVSTGSGGILQAAVAATGRQVIWLVESEDVVLFERPLAARGRKQLEKAVPYALEDDLAEDVEQLHVAFTGDGDRVHAAVVRRSLMKEALSALAAAGINPAGAIPDVLAVPLTRGRWGLLIDDGRALVRTGAGTGFACERELLSVLLPAALAASAEDARPEGLQVWCAEQDFELPQLHHLTVEPRPCESPWPVLAGGLAADAGPDLLQGEFSASERRARQLRRWWPAAAAVLAWAVLGLVSLKLEVGRLEHQRDLLNGAVEAVFRGAFPEVRRVENPKVQMEQGLKALKSARAGSRGFLAMLADASGPLQAQGGLTLKGMEFRNEILELTLEARDVQQLDALRQALESATGMQADIQSVNVEGDHVAARLRIREAKG